MHHRLFQSNWEVDWSHPSNNGSFAMARNVDSHLPSARAWHLVRSAHLRKCGIATPTYRKDAWEVDWARRDGKKVWARNPMSKMPDARIWHWVDQSTLQTAGVRWKPARSRNGRYKDQAGYVILTRVAMTDEDIEIATRFGLWKGNKKRYLSEHRLVAAKKFGTLGPTQVVRHVNGIKDDNRPDNLVVGTSAENTADHNTARVMCMYWHNQCDRLRAELSAIKLEIAARG